MKILKDTSVKRKKIDEKKSPSNQQQQHQSSITSFFFRRLSITVKKEERVEKDESLSGKFNNTKHLEVKDSLTGIKIQHQQRTTMKNFCRITSQLTVLSKPSQWKKISDS